MLHHVRVHSICISMLRVLKFTTYRKLIVPEKRITVRIIPEGIPSMLIVCGGV